MCVCLQWRSQVFESGGRGVYTKNRTGGFSRSPYAKKWILDWRGCNFPLSSLARIWDLLYCQIAKTIQLLSHPTLTISMQIWTNYETHVLKKWGGVYPDPGSASVCLFVSQVEAPNRCPRSVRPHTKSDLSQVVITATGDCGDKSELRRSLIDGWRNVRGKQVRLWIATVARRHRCNRTRWEISLYNWYHKVTNGIPDDNQTQMIGTQNKNITSK